MWPFGGSGDPPSLGQSESPGLKWAWRRGPGPIAGAVKKYLHIQNHTYCSTFSELQALTFLKAWRARDSSRSAT